jgi:hypothetical protein
MKEISFRDWAKKDSSKEKYSNDEQIFDKHTNEFKSKFLDGKDSKTANKRLKILREEIDSEKNGEGITSLIKVSKSLIKLFDIKVDDIKMSSESVELFIAAL